MRGLSHRAAHNQESIARSYFGFFWWPRSMQNLAACQKGKLRFLDRDVPAKWECNFKADRLRRLNKAKHRRISPSVF
jgi:hypothetical protein